MEAAIEKLQKEGVSEEELARAKRSSIAQAIYSLDNQTALANIVGQALVIGRTLQDVQSWPVAHPDGDGRAGAGGRRKIPAAGILRDRLSGARGRGAQLMSLSSFPRLSAILTGAVMTLALVSVSVPARAATVQEITSPGGLKAWLVEDYTVPIVTINAAFRGGAAQDPVGKPGLANLMSGLLDEGAGELDSRAFQAKLEDLSINLNFDAGSDAFYSNLRTLSVNLDDALELFRLAVTSPRFDAEPVARIRGQIIANLRQGETNPNEMVGKLWAETLFKDHPYGWPSRAPRRASPSSPPRTSRPSTPAPWRATICTS